MTGKTGVIYLLNDRLQLFSPMLGNVVEFKFVPEVVRDLDVVNKVLMENLIKVFVTNGKIPPSNLIILLSDNTYFIKDFTLPAQPPAQKTPQPGKPEEPKVTMEVLMQEADKFVEHVPYDNVVSKTFPMKNGMRVCAANKDFFDAVKGSFEKLGFTVESVIPGMVLGNNLSAKPVLDAALTSTVLQRSQSLKQYDLLTQETYVPASEKASDQTEEVEVEDPQNKKPDKKRLIALVGVLASLIIVLIIVFVQSQQPPTPPQQPAQASSPAAVKPASTVNTEQPTQAPVVATPVPTIPAATMKAFSVQLVSSSDSVAAGQTLNAALAKYGFKSVASQTQSTISSADTLVIFSSTVPQEVRNLILEEVRKVKSNITVQDRPSGTVDIAVIVGK